MISKRSLDTGRGRREVGDLMVCRLSKEFHFEAAHTLPHAPAGHKCGRVHGHSFRVVISIEGEVDPALGWVYEHGEISRAMAPLVALLDHQYLNEVEGLENPTLENLAAWLWDRLEPLCPGLCEIVVQETPTAWCTYRGPKARVGEF